MPTHQGRRATAAEAGEEKGRAFEVFSALHVFDLVLDELNLEHVAQLMMCCRSLREIGEGAKDWERAVREFSMMNRYNLCTFCEKATLPHLRSTSYMPYGWVLHFSYLQVV